MFGSAISLRTLAASSCFAAFKMSASVARANSKNASAAMVGSVESRCLKKKASFAAGSAVVELRGGLQVVDDRGRRRQAEGRVELTVRHAAEDQVIRAACCRSPADRCGARGPRWPPRAGSSFSAV